MQFFDDLGRRVEQRWKESNYNELVFPEIATQALAEADAIAEVNPWAIVQCLQTDREIPNQREDSFSDLPITLYNRPRFRIDVYFWLDGTTSVHQHGFSGAFQVLSGSSIHSRYDFEHDRTVNPQFSTGQVLLKNVELLEKGEIRPIPPGRQFIHSLFHLERPSVTLTVRTHQCPSALPQYDYLKPYMAIDPFYKEQATFKKIQSIMLLLRMRHPDAYSFLGEMVSSSDFQTTYSVLSTAFQHLVEETWEKASNLKDWEDDRAALPEERKYFNDLFKQARRKHGTLVNLILPVLGELQRERALVNLRKDVTSNEHRFFLALLLNVPHRALILDLVKRRHPDKEPINIICDWIKELATVKRSRAPERTVLGIDDFNDSHLYIIRCLLAGQPWEQIETAFGKTELSENGARTKDDPAKAFRSLQKSIVLKSLLVESTVSLDQQEPSHLSAQAS